MPHQLTPAMLTYADPALDRVGHLRDDPARMAALLRDPRAIVQPLWQAKHLVLDAETRPRLAMPGPAVVDHAGTAIRETVFLGYIHDEPTEDPRPVFVLDVGAGPLAAYGYFSPDDDLTPPDLGIEGVWKPLRAITRMLDPRWASRLALGRGMLYWHRRHRFCGVCGSPTRSEQAGYRRRCANPACGEAHFPRVDPAIITLVRYQDKALLGRGPRWPEGMYSTLAGFGEPGETLEDTVRREVFEEAGVQVDRVNYVASQPWPFPSSLMLGFEAWASSSRIRVDEHELEDARWFTAHDIEAAIRGQAPIPQLPPRESIARHLIDRWLRGVASG